jgi:hypothetical protein
VVEACGGDDASELHPVGIFLVPPGKFRGDNLIKRRSLPFTFFPVHFSRPSNHLPLCSLSYSKS